MIRGCPNGETHLKILCFQMTQLNCLGLNEVLRTESLNKYFIPEYIGFKEQTQGTETSKYLEERKSIDTPLVVASERGPAKPDK